MDANQLSEINVIDSHLFLLEMASLFHETCVKNCIPYYMLGGTQLGAIRHKGFVPWDDDMDFGVPRDYFPKMLESLRGEIPGYYRLHTQQDNEHYINGFAKLEDLRTVIKESGREGLTIGVNIDIFPLDHTNNNKRFLSKNWCINLLSKIQVYRYLNLNTLSSTRNVGKQILVMLTKNLKKKTIIGIIEKRLISSEGLYWANHFGAWGMREIVSKEIFGQPKLYEFENIQLFGVEKADEYLKHLYGDYMQLPPEDKRHLHIEHLYLKKSVDV